jgi:hypothetical protein
LEIVLESVAHQLHGSLFLECEGRRVVRLLEDSATIDIAKIPPYIEEARVADLLKRIEERLERTDVAPENLRHEFEYFRCFKITGTDKQDLKDFLGPAFAFEPLNTHLGLQGQQASIKFINFIVDTYSDNGLGIGVKDIRSKSFDQSVRKCLKWFITAFSAFILQSLLTVVYFVAGEIVSTILPIDYLESHNGRLDQFLEKECAVLLPIFHLIEQLHGQYFAERGTPTRPLEVVEIMAAAVHPLYYNRGLLNMICHFCLSNARGKTPEDMMILLEPTGAFSQVS